MNRWTGFLKKEWTESVKTYKLLLVAAIFTFLGVLNPFTAKITPILMKKLLPAGALVELPDPTALDSWLQFHKNVPQMGLIFFILLFSTMMSKELERGTLTMLLTKGLPRSTVITSKFFLAACYWTAAILLSSGITYAYTAFYWNQDGVHHLLFSIVSLYVFGLLILALTLWGNTFFASSYGGIVVALLAVGTMFLAAIFPSAADWNPLQLLSSASALLTGETVPGDLWLPCCLTVLLIFVSLWLTIAHFQKKLI